MTARDLLKDADLTVEERATLYMWAVYAIAKQNGGSIVVDLKHLVEDGATIDIFRVVEESTVEFIVAGDTKQ